MTACKLEKYFRQQLGLKATDSFRVMYAHTIVIVLYSRMNGGLKRFQTAIVTLKVTQGHLYLCVR